MKSYIFLVEAQNCPVDVSFTKLSPNPFFISFFDVVGIVQQVISVVIYGGECGESVVAMAWEVHNMD